MAWLKKVLTKPRFALVVGVWNAVTAYIAVALQSYPLELGLINTVGNLVIVWLGTESEQGQVGKN